MPTTLLPLHIDTIPAPGGGAFGLTHCPGRCGPGYGQRDLATDLAAIEGWGAALMISLNEPHEFTRLGVPEFPALAAARRFAWHHVPIPDMQTPGPAFHAAWVTAGPAIAATFARGDKVAIHCAAGLGRAGTLAAKLLVDLGLTPNDAIQRVREHRPGTIETAAQAAFVRQSPRLIG